MSRPDNRSLKQSLSQTYEAVARAPQGDPPEDNTQRQEWERKAWNAGAAAQFARTQKAIDRLEAEVVRLRAALEVVPDDPDLRPVAIQCPHCERPFEWLPMRTLQVCGVPAPQGDAPRDSK